MSDSRLSLKHHQLSTSKQIHQAKKKHSSRSQAWLAYLYVCSSAAACATTSDQRDEQYADKRIRSGDDDQDKKKQSGFSSNHNIFLEESALIL